MLALQRWLAAGWLCSAASLCGSCAPNPPALVGIAQAQGHYTDCAGLAFEEGAGCRRPSHEATISITAARDPPNFNMSSTCSSAAEWCLKDESSARDTLVKSWQRYSAADKMQCVGMVNKGGPPSYVELISCLETRREASAAEEPTNSATRRVEPSLTSRGPDNRRAERQSASGVGGRSHPAETEP
jgi:hypothetical protein